MRPASLDSAIVPRTFEPRATSGGRLGKNRRSELTVKSVGPEELPAVSFSSGKIRMRTPAGMYAGHSTTLARARVANTARQAITAVQARRDFIFHAPYCPLQNRESALH